MSAYLDANALFTLFTTQAFLSTQTRFTWSSILAGDAIFTLAAFTALGTLLSSWTCHVRLSDVVELVELDNTTRQFKQ